MQEEKNNTTKKSGKGKNVAVLKGAGKGGDNYDRNNNTAMINDVMGDDDYGDYGDE